MGLSRNKVAVPEGVAGTPPFWSVSEGTTRVWRVYEGVFSDQSFLHTTACTAAKCKFIDNTERKDQRGKEKQKESLYNLEFRSFFELENIGTAISRQEQIRNDSQAGPETGCAARRARRKGQSIRKETKSERRMPRLSGGDE